MTGPDTAPVLERAASIRDIPRWCSCDWNIRFTHQRPGGWERVSTKSGCPVHEKEPRS